MFPFYIPGTNILILDANNKSLGKLDKVCPGKLLAAVAPNGCCDVE
jgi:hypothetical protein